jgi:rhamnose utilization protein RhaD (predicted bifunctional aldolase and dehydrogenase)
MQELLDLVKISRYAGQRLDLVQAGGGNSSVKTSEGVMFIKASGVLLSEVNCQKGFSELNLNKLKGVFLDDFILNSLSKKERELRSADWVGKAQIQGAKPSIETTIHAILQKYVLHTHPIVVNMLVCREGWIQQARSFFPNDDFCFMEYYTPGIDLALALKNHISVIGKIPQVIFLQNHGLIVNSEKLEEIFELNECIVSKLEDFLGVNLTSFKVVHKLGCVLNEKFGLNDFIYKVEDLWLNQMLSKVPALFDMAPFAPDVVVFCGSGAVLMSDMNDVKAIEAYIEKFGVFPKVLIYNEMIFIIAPSLRKAKEMEEVLKFTILVLYHNRNQKLNFLKEDEIDYLNNWEAEKYRQKL